MNQPKAKPLKHHKEWTHNDDFIPAWITRGIMLIGIGIAGWFLSGLDKQVDKLIEKVISIDTKQEIQQKTFERFERDQSRKFDRIEEKLDKKVDKK